MLEVEEISAALKDRRLDIVAASTGLSVSTITKIRDGDNKNPTISTLKALNDYLTTKPKTGATA